MRHFSMKRREFLALTGVACSSAAVPPSWREAFPQERRYALYNFNYQAALGVGDERASIFNYRGELRSRHALVRWVFAGSRSTPSSQRLAPGYVPDVESLWNTHAGPARARISSVLWNGQWGDCLETVTTPIPAELQIFFPSYRPLRLEGSRLLSGDDVLVDGLPRNGVSLHLSAPQQAKAAPPPGPLLKPFLNYGLEHHFAAKTGNRYYLYWAVALTRPVPPRKCWFQWLVNDVGEIVLPSNETREHPMLHRFDVTARDNVVRVRCDPDPSVMASTHYRVEHALWMFDHTVDEAALVRGELNETALAHIGWDEGQPGVLRISFDAFAEGPRTIFLPYALEGRQTRAPSGGPVRSSDHWQTVLEKGAVFHSGDATIDNLYRASLINIFLLRTRYRGAGEHGEDLYVVKPGCGVYDNFWYRDGSYMVTALDRAGLPAEAEKSLRLFWQQSSQSPFKRWVQKADGAWDAPGREWDGQGQAPWALVNHFRLTGDVDYLRRVYPALRRGAEWIRRQTLSTRDQAPGRQTHYGHYGHYGLISPGIDEGEAPGAIYSYYLQRWALFGMQEIVAAAQVLGEAQDLAWMRPCCDEFHANLLASEEYAYKTTGKSQFLPASPDGAALDLWGIYNAVYPTGLLSPDSPMVAKTLDRSLAHWKEYVYTHNAPVNDGPLWLYMSIEWAFCFLLQDRRELFQRIFNSYVAHVSPVSAWCEGEYPAPFRMGTGDIPHGWAAAEFVHAVRNSFLLENSTNLELAWGVQPGWLRSGSEIRAQNAPSAFGVVDLAVHARENALHVTYRRTPQAGQAQPQRTRLHLPKVEQPLRQVVLNGRPLAITAGQTSIDLPASTHFRLPSDRP
jgi:hypothetical protein